MIVDRTDTGTLQRDIWGHQQSQIDLDLVVVIDDGIYNPLFNVFHRIENTIEEELR